MANSDKSGIYQSPLSKLFARQQPKVKAKKGMANLLLMYAENDSERIALLVKKWMEEEA
jgi:flagellar biosynthesis/type III secretory pathway M-ring protein FliF/YscJ